VSTAEHPRNHSGEGFTVLATKHADDPAPGGDEITRAVEEAWIGERGYARAGGSGGGGGGWQRRALAFLGEVTTASGAKIMELFVLDLPDDCSALREASGPATPLQGTSVRRPHPPHGVSQRRLTHTWGRAHPGLSQGGHSGPRFWPRSSPCGALVAVVALDQEGVPQLFTVRTAGGGGGEGGGSGGRSGGGGGSGWRQVTRLPNPGVESAFTWHPIIDLLAFVHDGSVCVVEVDVDEDMSQREGEGGGGGSSSNPRRRRQGVVRLTRRRVGEGAPRPEV